VRTSDWILAACFVAILVIVYPFIFTKEDDDE
jgi:hypothetical protein